VASLGPTNETYDDCVEFGTNARKFPRVFDTRKRSHSRGRRKRGSGPKDYCRLGAVGRVGVFLRKGAVAMCWLRCDTGASSIPTQKGQCQKRASQMKVMSLAVFAILAGPTVLAAGAAPQEFIKDAIEGNLAEVQAGRLAQQKAASPEVRELGARLEHDHAAANAKAEQVAQSLGVKVPGEPGAKLKQMYHELSVFSGEAFDRQFIQDMVQNHKEDIAKYEKAAQSASPVAQYAEQTLPDLQKHLQIAEQLQERRKSAKASNSSR